MTTYERQRAALRSDNSSGFKGVARVGAKWQASIRRNGRTVHLGLHSTPEAAAKAGRGSGVPGFRSEPHPRFSRVPRLATMNVNVLVRAIMARAPIGRPDAARPSQGFRPEPRNPSATPPEGGRP